MLPVLIPPNIIDHFYRGGAKIAELRGVQLLSPRRPEEWLAATVHRADEPDVGLSRLSDGRLFADVVAADPVGWIGSSAGGPGAGPSDTGILVKLLDAGQRLPVHVHPSRPFAGQHLHSCYGKTEAWFVLGVEGDPAVWVGFTEAVQSEELAGRVDQQDSDWMLSHLHKITVQPGDAVLVPAGTPHAIGAGVFVLEVQEPSDYSILLEWSVTTAGREDSHLGLGFDLALAAVETAATSPDALAELCRHTDTDRRAAEPMAVLPGAADPYFRVDVIAPLAGTVAVGGTPPNERGAGAGVGIDAGYAVAVVLDGTGELRRLDRDGKLPSDVEPVPVRRGQVWAVPAGFGDWAVAGDVRIALCRPGVGWPADLRAPD